jgi:preprotein translocase subunit SecA
MDMFDNMVASIREDTVRMLFTIQVRKNEDAPKREDVYKENKVHHNMTVRKKEKIGRNAPCPCGSGKKYKNCCGANKTTTAQAEKEAKEAAEKKAEEKTEE